MYKLNHITKYFKTTNSLWYDVTIRHLMCHESGLDQTINSKAVWSYMWRETNRKDQRPIRKHVCETLLNTVDPSKGRFRAFLLASLRHFLSHHREQARTLKRGGGTRTLSLDTDIAEERYQSEPDTGRSPEEVFERRWAMTVLDRAMERLRNESLASSDPNQFELAEAMEMTLDELNATRAEANAKTIFSLSEKWDDSDDDNEMEKVEILADKKCSDPVQTMHQKDVLDLITGNLTKKERLIIIMYYYEGLTMREIGEIMELTESRVCQIHSNVMSRLKSQLNRVNLQVK